MERSIVTPLLAWTKSSYGNGGTNCVELARFPPVSVAVRDSKLPAGPVLVFPTGPCTAFLSALSS